MPGAAPSRVLAGVLAAAVALGVTELLSAIVTAESPLVAAGDTIIRFTPEVLTRLTIATLGTADKPVFITVLVLLVLAAGAVIGRALPERPRAGSLGFATLAVLGIVALLADDSVGLGLLSPVLGAMAGWWTLRALVRRIPLDEGIEGPVWQPMDVRAPGRRAFLGFAAAAGGASVTSLLASRWIAERAVDVDAQRRALSLPTVVGGFPRGLDVSGLSPLVTPTEDFYRIDTALRVPRVDADGWRLRITGKVDRPFEVTLAELLAMPTKQEYITLSCVSNEVGGDLVGNALWLGVPLADLLARAGAHRDATQVVGRSVDGFTTGFPTEVALDGRASMVAFGMNGEPLSAVHGFPARLVVPGLYGYVSATKWLEEIELTTLEAFDAYWIPRGWDKLAPILTQSRIDVPRAGQAVTAGRVAIAGVAWGGDRSISRVEVQVRPRNGSGDAPWMPATLSEALSNSTWRQWLLEWDARPGDYEIRVRATDGRGETQTAAERTPGPNGATGYHRRDMRVRNA